MYEPGLIPSQKELRIHKVLSSLIQPLSEREYEDLALDLIEYGCKEPIRTWNGYILDGHKRYEICRHYGIPYMVEKVHLLNLPDAISHICQEQLHRDDLTYERRRYLIGKWYQAQRELAIWDVKAGSDAGSPVKLISAAHARGEKIADALGLTLGGVNKYRVYQQSLDAILAASPPLGRRILSGDVRLSHENTRFLGEQPPGKIRLLSQVVLEQNMTYLCRKDMLWHLNGSAQEKQTKEAMPMQAQIKNMPAFDPDAEVSSLAFTIPSWCSMISRTQSSANLHQVSGLARMRLIGQLETLKSQADLLLKSLKE